MLAAPHPMAPGTEDTSYYRGEVSRAVPEQVAWVTAHRPDDESLGQFGVGSTTTTPSGGGS